MSHAARKCVGKVFMSFRKIPTITGELDYTPCGTKLTEEKGKRASFLRDRFEEVPGKLLGSLLGLVQTVLFGVNTPSTQVPEQKSTPLPAATHQVKWMDPSARPCLQAGGCQG